MPLVYTKEEIRKYLDSRGFDVTNEAIINQFIHDLKKLVKFEDRQRRRIRLGHDAHETNLDSTGQSGDVVTGGDRRNHAPDSNRTHTADQIMSDRGRLRHGKDGRQNKLAENGPPTKSAPQQHHDGRNHSSRHRHTDDEDTVDHLRGHKGVHNVRNRELSPKHFNGKSDSTRGTSPREKLPLRREKNDTNVSTRRSLVGKVELNGLVMSRKTLRLENGDPVIEESLVPIGSDGHNKQRTRPFTATGVVTLDVDGHLSRTSNLHENKNESLSSLRVPSSRLQGPDMLRILGRLLEESDKDDELESLATTRTIRGPPNRVRRDPVALYHYYKKYWDKLKIPGEDRHMQTRWNVRAQTVGNYPCFEGQPVNYLSRH